MENLISVKNLSVGFRSQHKKTNVVHSISFDIPKGKTTALVGESGSGKTVTALSILKLLVANEILNKVVKIIAIDKSLYIIEIRFSNNN